MARSDPAHHTGYPRRYGDVRIAFLMSFTRGRGRAIFAATNLKPNTRTMNTNYLSCREKAIRWIDDPKRPFAKGLAILQESGYKPVATANVAKRGERNDFARAKLTALMYELIRLWHDPEMAGQDESPEPEEIQDPEQRSVEEVNSICDSQGYPESVRRAIHEFYALMNERRETHAKAAAIEGNDPERVAERAALLDRVERISIRMDELWAAKQAFERDNTLPPDGLFNPAKEDGTDTDNTDTGEIPEEATVEELKRIRKNLGTKLTRTRNMLEFRQATKADQPDPMPEGPRRAKYEKKAANLAAAIEKVEYRIVELS